MTHSSVAAVRQLALEAMAYCKATHPGDCEALLEDFDEGIRSVAAATLLRADPENAAALAVLRGSLQSEFALSAISVLRFCGHESVAEVLALFGTHDDAEVRAAALNAVGSLKTRGTGVLDGARVRPTHPSLCAKRRCAC